MKRIFKWSRWLFFALVCIATVAALVVGEENLRGRRAWDRCKRDLEAQGVHMDIAANVPPQIPDDQNVAMAPVFKAIYDYQAEGDAVIAATNSGTASTLGKMRIQSPPPPVMELSKIYSGGDDSTRRPVEHGGGPRDGTPRDLRGWQAYFRAVFPKIAHPESPEEDVLASMAGMDPLLAEIRDAVNTRPLVRFPVKYELGPETGLPHIPVQFNLVRALSLRIIAELRLGRVDDAFSDTQLLFQIRDLGRDEPLMISGIARSNATIIAASMVWEGIRLHRWSDAQLAFLEQQLAQYNGMADCLRGLHAEQAVVLQGMTLVCGDPRFAAMNATAFPESERWMLYPTSHVKGWIYQNAALQAGWLQQCAASVDEKTRRVDLPAALALRKSVLSLRSTPWTFLTKLSAPVLIDALRLFAVSQTYADEARIACAIERYRLAHGSLPATLDDLRMENLPHDVISGDPLHYRPAGQDYILYSVGWNGVDDGGKVIFRDSKNVDYEQGDWVWSLTPL